MKQVITIDGPSGVGKGSTALSLANKLGWSLLDSGSIYRTFGLYAQRKGLLKGDVDLLVSLAKKLPIHFDEGRVFLGGEDVSTTIRTEEVAAIASDFANVLPVRQALLKFQRLFAEKTNLVADGRDMGTVVFPQATLKIFLTASIEERINRRIRQLEEMNQHFDRKKIVETIRNRDAQDMNRSHSPLIPAHDAITICNDSMSLPEVLLTILEHAKDRGIECTK